LPLLIFNDLVLLTSQQQLIWWIGQTLISDLTEFQLVIYEISSFRIQTNMLYFLKIMKASRDVIKKCLSNYWYIPSRLGNFDEKKPFYCKT